jgi:hypothetical protein
MKQHSQPWPVNPIRLSIVFSLCSLFIDEDITLSLTSIRKQPPHVFERFEFQRIAAGIQQEEGGLLANLALEADAGREDEGVLLAMTSGDLRGYCNSLALDANVVIASAARQSMPTAQTEDGSRRASLAMTKRRVS